MSLGNKFFSILTLAAATFAFSAIGMAQETTTVTPMSEKGEKIRKGDGLGKHGHDGRRGGHGKMGRGMGMLRGIDLSEEQRTQIRTIMEAQKPTAEAMTEIRTLATAKREGTITAEQQERLTVLKQQRKEKSLVIKAQIDAILTTEQKAQIETKKQEMKFRMQERRQKRQQPATATETAKPAKDN